MKHLLKKSDERISAYLRENRLNVSHLTSFNLIQQPRTIIQIKMFCFIEAETNKCLMQHCVVV